MTQFVEGLNQVIDGYDGLIVDLWGVMHNGESLFPEAIAALKHAKSLDKSITFLSNAPRRRDAALTNLIGRLGLEPSLLDNLVTSGEIAWQAIKKGELHSLGTRAFFFGAPKDQDMKAGLSNVEFVDTLERAEWILNVGPDQGYNSTLPFEYWLKKALALQLPMICANPDLIVQRGKSVEICAGSIAQAYVEIGGKVSWFGKPYKAVYDEIFRSSQIPANRLLAIGDSFKTDVRGAIAHGIDVLYVNSGIHRNEISQPMDQKKFNEMALIHQAWPTYAADKLAP
ncbi:MAG: TIGR01459 family HAD-type hydrolase [Alphaproteobacteria bacterium]